MKLTLWKGAKSQLPETVQAGALYFITDTQEIYFDKDSTTRVLMGTGNTGTIDKIKWNVLS